MLIDLERKLIRKTLYGLEASLSIFIIFDFFYGERFISSVSLLVLVVTLLVDFKFRKGGPIRNILFFGLIGLILYYSLLCHYFSIYFQFVFIYTLLFLYSSILFKGSKRTILHGIILIIAAILIYFLREKIYFIKAGFDDDSFYIQVLRVAAYLLMAYFFYTLYKFYKERGQLSRLQYQLHGYNVEGYSQKDIKDLFDAIDRKDNTFMPVFLEYYPHFLDRLAEINSKITSNEIEICALLKLGLTTKEIAIATNSTYKAIESARFRIRKKLNLETHIDLISFFSSL